MQDLRCAYGVLHFLWRNCFPASSLTGVWENQYSPVVFGEFTKETSPPNVSAKQCFLHIVTSTATTQLILIWWDVATRNWNFAHQSLTPLWLLERILFHFPIRVMLSDKVTFENHTPEQSHELPSPLLLDCHYRLCRILRAPGITEAFENDCNRWERMKECYLLQWCSINIWP